MGEGKKGEGNEVKKWRRNKSNLKRKLTQLKTLSKIYSDTYTFNIYDLLNIFWHEIDNIRINIHEKIDHFW